MQYLCYLLQDMMQCINVCPYDHAHLPEAGDVNTIMIALLSIMSVLENYLQSFLA